MRFQLARYRRVIQALFFVVFVLLLVLTAEHTALPFASQLFLEFNPLIALVAVIAGLPLISALLYSLATMIATLLFGRVFCGYACPMGTLLDLFAPLAKVLHIDQKVFKKLKILPLITLVTLLALSVFKIGFVTIFDPISLITRVTAVAITSVKYLAHLYSLYSSMPYTEVGILEFGRELGRGFNSAMTSNYPKLIDSSEWILLLFVLTVSLNALGKRFWCRYLCPLGGLLGLVGRVPLFRRKVDATACTNCMRCTKSCDMQAVTNNGLATDAANCTLCLKCRGKCRQAAISWGLKPELTNEIPSRRAAITAIGGSITVAGLVPFMGKAKAQDSTLIRPPGVSNEELFLSKCVRCGECLAACPTNVLQPALLQYGASALWTPHLDFTASACDYSCNACGQVCPTGAIKYLTLEEKQTFAIGTAEIDQDTCYRCGICVRVCPVPGAIGLARVPSALSPFGGMGAVSLTVDSTRCVGCGECEVACPLRWSKAIKVVRSDVGSGTGSSTSGSPSNNRSYNGPELPGGSV